MKQTLTLLAVALFLGTADANAQGFLKKLKQKAQAAVGIKESKDVQEKSQDSDSNNDSDAADNSKITVAQSSDAVPKRKSSTVTWDGVITPSSASTSSALMSELPALPSAEKMARSTMEERDAYTQKIAAVVTRAEQLQKEQTGCSDAEMEALRQKWEGKVQDLLGITQQELAILQDDNASEAQKEPIRQKIAAKAMGGNTDMSEMERFQQMSESEQQAYLRSHPEFIQKMQNMAANARNFSRQAYQMTAGINSYETQLGQLFDKHNKFVQQEEQHSYVAIAKKYEGKLKKLYDEVCNIEDQARIDALYDEADQLLYNYRLEAAREYRASLQRQIDEAKKMAAQYAKITKEAVAKGDLPQCAVGRMDLNMVIVVGNLLDKAYKDLPKLETAPVCMATIYTLEKGWWFCPWECRGYVGSVSGFDSAGTNWPLLAAHEVADGEYEYGKLERGQFSKISESELKSINKKADQRAKQLGKSAQKPPYGVYKSRNGKRTVAFSQTGELIVNEMTTFVPCAFTAKDNCLEWVIIDDNKIVKCTYKL